MKNIFRLFFYLFGFFHDILFLTIYLVRTFFRQQLESTEINKDDNATCGIDKFESFYLKGFIQVLSNRYVYFNGNWNVDPYSKYKWKLKWHKLSNRERPQCSDIKIPWEIGRLQHLTSLTLTSTSSIVKAKIVSEINNFIDSNLPYFGVQWACPMDVSIRSINLTIIITYLFSNKEVISNKKIILYLKEQYRYISFYDEKNGELRNNHYFTNLLGQLVLCHFFYKFLEEKKYLADIDSILMRFKVELDFQFRGDSFNFEGSSNYHRLSTEITFWFYIYLKDIEKFDSKDSEMLKEKLKDMIKHLKVLSNGIGLTHVGDTDSGVIVDFNFSFVEDTNDIFFKDISKNGLFLLKLDLDNLDKYNLHSVLNDVELKRKTTYPVKNVKIKRVSLKNGKWLLPTELSLFNNTYINLELGVIKVFFKNGWILIKTKGKSNSGHSHFDFLRVECCFDDCFYSLFPGTESYSITPEKRVFNRSDLYKHKTNISGGAFARLPEYIYNAHSECKVSDNVVNVIYDGKYIKLSSTPEGVLLQSNTAPFLYPDTLWGGYNFNVKLEYL